MVEKILTYPDERIRNISQDIHKFDEELFGLIDDMKDTMQANNLDALAAIQIGYKAKVILIKDENGDILELINARVTEAEDSVAITETTSYYPGITININRFNKIKVSYQDRDGVFRSLRPSAELGWLIQRKIDYTFSATSIQKVNKEELRRIEKLLAKGVGPVEREEERTVNYRDYLYKVVNYLLILGFASLFAPLFTDAAETLAKVYLFEQILSTVILILIIIYFFYAQYESKRQRVCTSCQTTNIFALSMFASAKLIVFFIAGYFLVNPA